MKWSVPGGSAKTTDLLASEVSEVILMNLVETGREEVARLVIEVAKLGHPTHLCLWY